MIGVIFLMLFEKIMKNVTPVTVTPVAFLMEGNRSDRVTGVTNSRYFAFRIYFLNTFEVKPV